MNFFFLLRNFLDNQIMELEYNNFMFLLRGMRVICQTCGSVRDSKPMHILFIFHFYLISDALLIIQLLEIIQYLNSLRMILNENIRCRMILNENIRCKFYQKFQEIKQIKNLKIHFCSSILDHLLPHGKKYQNYLVLQN